MATTKAERLATVHQRMVERFDRVWGAVREERLQCLEDRRFYIVAGAQWEGPLYEQFANKPRFEFSKVHNAVQKVVGEYRQNRITVDYTPRTPSPAASSAADAANALYRDTEHRSSANEAYDNAFEEGASGGMGGWRLRAVPEDEENPDDTRQVIVMEPVFDADSRMFFDDNAKRADKADAQWGFLITPQSREAYMAEWSDDPASWPVETTLRAFDWCTPDLVFVAEYYEVEMVTQLVRVFEHLDGAIERHSERDFEEDEELERRLLAVGARQITEYQAKVRRVHKYIASGAKVLEDCGRIAGKCIPLVVTYGKRWVVDGIERCSGIVRTSKDAQRLKNMLGSKLAEISAQGSVEKPIFTPAQIAGHTTLWARDNIDNNPYLLLNPLKDPQTGQIMPAGPVAYTKPPQVPQALAALMAIADIDMKEMLGSQEQAEKVVSNVSERAISLVQQRLDTQSFIYMSNFQRAVERSGQIWLSMAKELMVERGRKVIGRDAQGDAVEIELQRASADPKTSQTFLSADIPGQDLELVVSFGPSSASRRTSTVRDLTAMMAITQDPETLVILSSMAMMNIEGEGMEDIRGFFRKKLLRLGAIDPTDEEKREMQAESEGKPEDSQAAYLRAEAEKALALAIKSRADTILSLARAEQSRADTAKTLDGVERDNVADLLSGVDQLSQGLQQQAGAPPALSPASV